MWVIMPCLDQSRDQRERKMSSALTLSHAHLCGPGERTNRHPPVPAEAEIQPLPKDKECCYQEKVGKGPGPTQHIYVTLERKKKLCKTMLLLFYVRCLLLQISLLLQPWKVKTRIWLLIVFWIFPQTFEKLTKFAIPPNDTWFLMFGCCCLFLS